MGVLTTRLVMVGVSRTGVAARVVAAPPASGKLAATAVMVRLTLGTTSLLTDVCVVLPVAREAVVCGRAVVRGLAAPLLLTAAWARVNMVAGGRCASRTENFLLVTWCVSLTNMGRWRHGKRYTELLPLLRWLIHCLAPARELAPICRHLCGLHSHA